MKNIYNIFKNFKYVFKIFSQINKIPLLTICIYYLFLGVAPAIYTWVSAKIFETITNNMAANKLWSYIIFFLLLFAFRSASEILVDIPRSCYIYTKSNLEFKKRISRKTAQIKYYYLEESQTYDLLTRAYTCVSDNQLQKLLLGTLELFFSVLGLFGILNILVSFSYWFLVIFFFFNLPFLFIYRLKADYYKLNIRQTPTKRFVDYLWSLFSEKASAKELYLHKSHHYIFELWNTNISLICKEKLQYTYKEAKFLFLCDIAQSICIFISLLFSLALLYKKQITIGQFISVIYAFFSFQAYAKNSFLIASDLYATNKFVNDFFHYLHIKEEPNYQIVVNDFHEITFNNVYFKYTNKDTYTLKNINLKIVKGSFIVVVGENGSGKTTLMKLLMGFLQPQRGSVRIDAFDVQKIEKTSLYSLFSIVPQDFTKFNFSIKENIFFNEQNVDIQHVEKILNKVNVLNNINIFDNIELGTEFGGQELSGGQWQQIAILRSLYKNSQILILDEPTASLDPLQESAILRDFLKAAKNRTTIMISHRIGICSLADEVIVMKDGKIEAQGLHSELVRTCGYYKELYLSQKKWYT